MQIPESILRLPIQHAHLRIALHAAAAGCEELRQRFGRRVEVESKGIANFVSEADKEAERVILETLRGECPTHGFLAEESQSSIVSSVDHLWIVDPLDGTSNFLHGIPHFAVSIAYYRSGYAELGVVVNPISQDWYIAVKGQGAWTSHGRQSVCGATRLDEAMVSCGFYYDRGAMMRATLDTIATLFECHIHGIRRFGAAALDLCNLGCGQYGLFFEYRLHPWDYAAGQLFVHEAGGLCTTCDGHPLPLDGPSSIYASNKKLHPASMQKIEPHWRGLQSQEN